MKERIEIEQEAFDAALGQLLETHAGEFVVFKDEKPSGFYGSFKEAYAEALQQYGLNGAFLVSEIQPTTPGNSSLSWDLGVL